PPTAAIGGGAATSPEGTALNLNATVTDPGAADVLTYAWSVTRNGAPYSAAGSGSVFNFTPSDDGAFVVTLTVSADDGGTTTVTNAPPTAAITGAPAAGPEGTAIALGSTATDPSTDDAAALTRSWSVTKNGAAFATGSGASFGFTPNDNGTYVVTLTVSDGD